MELVQLARIIDIEYHDIVVGVSRIYHDKIRTHLLDGSLTAFTQEIVPILDEFIPGKDVSHR